MKRKAREGRSNCLRCATAGRLKANRQTAETRIKVLRLYGGECACCGQPNMKYLELDHSNNDGAKERKSLPASVRGTKFFSLLLKQFQKTGKRRKDLQVLCANCHKAKRYGGCVDTDHDSAFWHLHQINKLAKE